MKSPPPTPIFNSHLEYRPKNKANHASSKPIVDPPYGKIGSLRWPPMLIATFCLTAKTGNCSASHGQFTLIIVYKPVKPGLSSTCFHCLAHEVWQPSFFNMPMLLTSLCNHKAQNHSGTINTTFGHVVHLPLLPLVLIFALCLTLVSNSNFLVKPGKYVPPEQNLPSKASNNTAWNRNPAWPFVPYRISSTFR